ncbi:MAG: hypothetical protein JRJ31_16905 [Deltaproteobacteria bacterium]|nr:hypothetical protein [Deltaproteobacteria bacterium]
MNELDKIIELDKGYIEEDGCLCIYANNFANEGFPVRQACRFYGNTQILACSCDHNCSQFHEPHLIITKDGQRIIRLRLCRTTWYFHESDFEDRRKNKPQEK